MIQKLKTALNQVILGKESSVELLLAALLADGHVLIEDVPGTGKTTLAKIFARAVNCADYNEEPFNDLDKLLEYAVEIINRL